MEEGELKPKQSYLNLPPSSHPGLDKNLIYRKSLVTKTPAINLRDLRKSAGENGL